MLRCSDWLKTNLETLPKEINEKDWRKPEDIDYPEYYGHYRYMDWIYPFTVDIGTALNFSKIPKKQN